MLASPAQFRPVPTQCLPEPAQFRSVPGRAWLSVPDQAGRFPVSSSQAPGASRSVPESSWPAPASARLAPGSPAESASPAQFRPVPAPFPISRPDLAPSQKDPGRFWPSPGWFPRVPGRASLSSREFLASSGPFPPGARWSCSVQVPGQIQLGPRRVLASSGAFLACSGGIPGRISLSQRVPDQFRPVLAQCPPVQLSSGQFPPSARRYPLSSGQFLARSGSAADNSWLVPADSWSVAVWSGPETASARLYVPGQIWFSPRQILASSSQFQSGSLLPFASLLSLCFSHVLGRRVFPLIK